MSNLHIKKCDTVIIISGKDKGKKGKVLEVSPSEGKVIIEGRNIVTKHVKPRQMGDAGGIVKAEGALYASKVMVVCPACGKPTRVAHQFTDSSEKFEKKIRVCCHKDCRKPLD